MSHQTELRGAAFFGGLALWLALERAFPRRGGDMRRALRWRANFGLVAIDTVVLLTLPAAAMGTAMWAQAQSWGLFNHAQMPYWLSVMLAWALLDLAIYWQHRAFHEVRWLWPLHRVHHSDIEFDASTGVRFHPAEILLSMVYKCGLVLALGAPPLAVLVFEVALNGAALFSHANLRLPLRFERALRRLIITPDMHRAHHSIHRAEMDSNYSNVFSLWDRLFRSYTPQPREGHEGMRIGLAQFRDARQQGLLPLLTQPIERG